MLGCSSLLSTVADAGGDQRCPYVLWTWFLPTTLVLLDSCREALLHRAAMRQAMDHLRGACLKFGRACLRSEDELGAMSALTGIKHMRQGARFG